MSVLNSTDLSAILSAVGIESLRAVHGGVQKLDAGKIDTAARGAANGVASLGPDGRIPQIQIDFSGVEDVINLIYFGDETPLTAQEGERYFNTVTNQVYTWTGGAWDAGATPSGSKFYLWSGDHYTWNGTTLVQSHRGGASSTAFLASDSAWADNLDGTFSLPVDIGVSGPVDAGSVFDASGQRQNMVDVTRVLSSGNTILTIRAFEAFSGEVCWTQIA